MDFFSTMKGRKRFYYSVVIRSVKHDQTRKYKQIQVTLTYLMRPNPWFTQTAATTKITMDKFMFDACNFRRPVWAEINWMPKILCSRFTELVKTNKLINKTRQTIANNSLMQNPYCKWHEVWGGGFYLWSKGFMRHNSVVIYYNSLISDNL